MLFKTIIILLLVFIFSIALAKIVIKLITRFLSYTNYKFTNFFSFLIEVVLIFILSVLLGEKVIYTALYLTINIF